MSNKHESFASNISFEENCKKKEESDYFQDKTEVILHFKCSLCKIKVESFEEGENHVYSYHGIKNFQKSFIVSDQETSKDFVKHQKTPKKQG